MTPAVEVGPAKAAEAASLAYHHQMWTPDDGLPSNTVDCLLQTRDGWLWIGTRSGLARFDGIKFTVFDKSTPGFTDHAILALTEDASGNLWIATKQGLYRKQGGVFTRYTTSEGLLHNHVAGFHLSPDGTLWIATHGGLNRLKDGVLTGFPLTETVDNNDGQSNTYHEVLTATEDLEGNIWAGTLWGLKQFDPLAGHYLPVWRSPALRSGTFQAPVQVVFEDRNHGLWFGTDDILVRRDGGGWRESRFDTEGGDARLRRIVQDRDGTIWVVRAGKLFRVSGDTLVREDERLGLGDSYVTDVLFSSEGILWVGTRHRGLQCLRPAAMRVFTTRDDLSHNSVGSVSPGRDGGLWVATQRGLMRLHNGEFAFPKTDATVRDLACRVVFEESSGDVWLGAAPDHRGFIHCLEKRPARYHALRAPGTAQEPSAIFEDSHRRLWIGERVGLACLFADDPTTIQEEDPSLPEVTFRRATRWVFESSRAVSRMKKLPAEFTTNLWRYVSQEPIGFKPLSTAPREYLDGSPIRLDQQLSAYDVRAILEDRSGDLWFGTWGGGLNRLRDRQIEVFTTRDGLAGDRIQALHQDADGVLWIGTTEGLTRIVDRSRPPESALNPQSAPLPTPPRFISFTTAHGLPDNQVNQILDDNAGFLWIGCDEGIYRVPKRGLTEVAAGRASRVECLLLDEQDGLSGGQTHSGIQPSACKTPDGRLWFATPHGLAMVDPANIPRRDTQPKVFVERVRVGDALLELMDEPGGAINGVHRTGGDSPPRRFQQFQSRPTSAASLQGAQIQLPAGSGRSLAFEFTALEYLAPKKLRFRYRLAGFDPDWVEGGVSRNAYYTNLKPGDYQFQVIAADRNNVWNESGASFAFRITPHLWQRWWFHPAWLLAAALAGFGLHRRRVRQIAAFQELEKAAELARQRALLGADLHDAAGASLCQIVRQCEQVDAVSGDGRLGAIATTAREALEAFDETVWLLKPGNETLDRLASRLIRTADKLIEHSGARGRWQIPENLPALPLKAEAQRDLLLIVKESIHNILKHARASEVQLQLALTERWLTIVVADNGRGFDTDSPAAADRNGMTSLRRRADKWGARLEITSGPGTGTRVEVVVPMDRISGESGVNANERQRH